MTKNENKLRPETLTLHGGQEADPVTGSRAVPIYQTRIPTMRQIFLR